MRDSLPTPCVVLENVITGRFHPVPFRVYPMRVPIGGGRYERYKSIGHHTAGFPTLDEAVAYVRGRAGWWLPELHCESWDSVAEPIPALVRVFPTCST